MNEEDRSRLEEFRQFRKEIRGSKEYLLVGIDVAKEKHYAFFGTAQGKTLFRRLVFENNIEGFRKLMAQARAMKDQNGCHEHNFKIYPQHCINDLRLKKFLILDIQEKCRWRRICQRPQRAKRIRDRLVDALSHYILDLSLEIGKYRFSISHKRLHPFRNKVQGIAAAEKVPESKIPFQIVQ
jgi:hypothetical protein